MADKLTLTKLNKKIEELEERIKFLENASSDAYENALMDSLYKKSKELVIKHKKYTPIFLQKKLFIDFVRASKIINKLKEEKVI